MLEKKLNTTYINKIIICFESKIFLDLINTIQVYISIDIANFYNINIYILVFFYLKNMDTFNIYLNNIINQLICQNGKSIFIIYK